MYKVFIDGQEGTTGLKIFNRLSARKDIQLLNIEEKDRKNTDVRLEYICEADVTFLCLPDQAAREIASKAPQNARIIDASTAHRTDDTWTYGFPEISGNQRDLICKSNRVSVPGCHASGFISIVRPLIENNIIKKDTFLACTSITGYSGGGKPMIKEYETDDSNDLKSPGLYALTQNHKHMPEMIKISGLSKSPAFIPIISNYYSGMLVTIPIDVKMMSKEYRMEEIERLFKEFYLGKMLVKVTTLIPEERNGMLYANKMSGRDDMEILVYGNEETVVISSRYDNLGKGASGAAIQCMNIMLGIEETTSLVKGNNYG
ncbi:MAG: N-acetyl-gamma-glutamyl-phosphate reductase [Peptostreptococcaceae bacterium]|nr:N-acetyl-gamma-glutamyl-phosphate reductase [Peptostreptococcaceae bacterium]